MDHDELLLMRTLAGLNERVVRFVLREHGRPPAGDGMELGRDMVILGRALRRHTRVRTASWGRACLQPHLGHVRAIENGVTAVSVIDGATVGLAVCGAWLVGDMPDSDGGEFTPCPACLDTLGQEL